MRRTIWSVVVLLAWSSAAALAQVVVLPAAPATKPAEADVPVREVVLFSSGVGYFEHFGTVQGDGAAVLHFKTEQINDILKSLVLEDLDGGKVATVTYPSQSPLTRTLKSFAIDITDNPPLSELLNQLRGAKLTVATSTGAVTGTIMGVEKKRLLPTDATKATEYDVLTLRAGRKIQQLPIDGIVSLEMDDERLNAELDAALAALAKARDQDKKPVEIHFHGAGQRRVRMGYVVEAPVWKTSYRLVLEEPKGAAAKIPGHGAKLQGWAIVENQTDNDWTDVQMSLVSGRPISFIQDLYHSLYIPRPVVNPESYASLIPQTYENGITAEELEKLKNARAESDTKQREQIEEARNRNGQTTNMLFAGSGSGRGGSVPEAPIDPAASVVAAASASGLGELFQYTVGNVSIRRQQSAMIPIVTDNIEAERISIYNEQTLANHPLNGVRLKNTTGKHLLQGPITVLEAGGYAGDAKIDDLPPGQHRLLSYGIDLKVLVDSSDEPDEKNSVRLVQIIDGVLKVQETQRQGHRYLINNQGDTDKIIVVEHPRNLEGKLVEPAKADELTESHYRFDLPVGAGKTVQLKVVTDEPVSDTVELLPADFVRLEPFLKLEGIPVQARSALEKIIQIKHDLADLHQKIKAPATNITDTTAEQVRLRENMKAVASTTDYYNRLIKKLDEQETQIENWQKAIDSLRQEVEAREKELAAMIGQLKIE
jgi:hypothetical protein